MLLFFINYLALLFYSCFSCSGTTDQKKNTEGVFTTLKKSDGTVFKQETRSELQYYSLIDCRTAKVHSFQSNQRDKFQTIELKDKKSGLVFDDDFSFIKTDIDDFKYEKDTIDQGRKVKLFRNYKRVTPPGGTMAIRRTIYMDFDFVKLPFHPFSKSLDVKFGGTAYRFESMDVKGNYADLIWEFRNGLSSIEKQKIYALIGAVLP